MERNALEEAKKRLEGKALKWNDEVAKVCRCSGHILM
jgi:hypothetical protein